MIALTAYHLADDVADKAAALEAQGRYAEAAREWLRAAALCHDNRDPGTADLREDAALTCLRASEVS